MGGVSTDVTQKNVCVSSLETPPPSVSTCVHRSVSPPVLSGLALSDEGTAGQEVDVKALLRPPEEATVHMKPELEVEGVLGRSCRGGASGCTCAG